MGVVKLTKFNLCLVIMNSVAAKSISSFFNIPIAPVQEPFGKHMPHDPASLYVNLK